MGGERGEQPRREPELALGGRQRDPGCCPPAQRASLWAPLGSFPARLGTARIGLGGAPGGRRWAGGGAWDAGCLLAEWVGGGASHLACHTEATTGGVWQREHGPSVLGDSEDSQRGPPTQSEDFRGAVPEILATQVSEVRTGCRGSGVDAREEPAQRAAAASWTR